MTSKGTLAVALFLSLNLIFFSLATACGCKCGSCRTPKTRTPTPTPTMPVSPSSPSSKGKCPIDALKLGVCANVLNGLLNLELGTPPKKPCCSLISGLADLEAALCLCTALRANILGLNLNVAIDLSLLVNYCGKSLPSAFQCP